MSYEPTEWVRGTKITATKLNNIEQGVQSVNSEYTPTTWAEGDIVTATKLNNIEQGIVNAGGGGGGDFSTAEVTVVNQSEYNFWLSLPNIYGDELYSGLDSGDLDDTPLTTVLYKNAIAPSVISRDEHEFRIEGSGSVVISPDTHQVVAITGDCTLTISDAVL